MVITTLPRTPFDELPERARCLYRLMARRGDSAADFTADEDAWAAAGELDEHNWGQRSDGTYIRRLSLTRYHAAYTELFAWPTREPGLAVELAVHDQASNSPRHDEGAVLLRGVGARIYVENDRPLPRWSIDIDHETATDPEHDPVHLARFNITAPVTTRVDTGGGLEIVGVLGELRAWPLDADPFAGETDACAGQHCTPHPFGPYLAPESQAQRALAGSLVTMRTAPHSP